MLWVYGHYKYFTLSVRGSTLYARMCMTYKDVPRAGRVKQTLGQGIMFSG